MKKPHLNKKLTLVLTLLITIASLFLTTPLFSENNKEINVYSYRQKFLIQPFLDAFTEKTKIKVNVIYIKKGLVQRIKLEGKQSSADLILTTDVGQLVELEKANVLAPVKDPSIQKIIPAAYRSKKNLWFGLTARSRIIYASKERVAKGAIGTYEELADPKWKGKICIRSGYHPYNIALFSSLYEHMGKTKFKKWLLGLKSNLAQKPQGNDRGQVKAIKEGVCDLALGNSYYYGKMVFNEKTPEEKEWAAAVNLIFPDQNGRGAHMNISGMAMAKYSKNQVAAKKLMRFLVSDKAQYLYSKDNFEFPLNPKVEYSEFLKKYMGKKKWDNISLEKVASHRSTIAKILDEVNFDN